MQPKHSSPPPDPSMHTHTRTHTHAHTHTHTHTHTHALLAPPQHSPCSSVMAASHMGLLCCRTARYTGTGDCEQNARNQMVAHGIYGTYTYGIKCTESLYIKLKLSKVAAVAAAPPPFPPPEQTRGSCAAARPGTRARGTAGFAYRHFHADDVQPMCTDRTSIVKLSFILQTPSTLHGLSHESEMVSGVRCRAPPPPHMHTYTLTHARMHARIHTCKRRVPLAMCPRPPALTTNN